MGDIPYVDYDAIADIYDELVAEALPTRLSIIDKILNSHSRIPLHTMLEFGCGTGLILRHFSSRLAVAGVDASDRMLEHARKKLPSAELHLGDIRQYTTGKCYDVVLCVYDTINHLLSIEDWEAAVKNARRQTAPGGLFLLDMNTTEKLGDIGTIDGHRLGLDEEYARPLVQWLSTGCLSINICTDESFLSHWSIDYFRRASDGRYDLLKTCIIERAFPLEAVQNLLERHFARVECFNSELGRGNEKSGRVYFVCGAD